MSKEFVWNIDFDGEEKIWKCIVHENEVVTYEGEEERKHLKITNPESKQGVLQIDTVTKVYDLEVPFQLERGIPYIKLGNQWTMSGTTFEERKQKLIKTHKINAFIQLGIGAAMGLACLIRYLMEGSMGNWWFMLILGSIMAVTGFMQYKDLKSQLAELDKADE